MTWKKVALILVGLLVLAFVVGACTIDKWLFEVLNPGAFDPSKTPKAPDYASASSWAALPQTKDGADVALPSHPAAKAPKADVFYLHPTTALGPMWNAPIDTPDVIKATHRGGTLIQASAFNGCCRVFAPRYRQANGRAFVSPNDHGQKALDVAYKDVQQAFRHFLKHQNKGRPFILAGHSQGAAMAARLLREEIAGKPAQARLVAAYLIGVPIRQKDLAPGLPVCQQATQLGCVVAYNARGPKYKYNPGFEFTTKGTKVLSTQGWLCVNPLTWKQDGALAPKARHKGALFFDAAKPSVLPSFASAQCKGGRLVTQPGKIPSRDVMSSLLMWIIGPQNYHPVEYQLFYLNLRHNAIQRVDAFLKKPR